MIPAKSLKKYDTVIFEPDGVFTSNRHFLVCAVLAVYEMCHSNRYFGKIEMDCSSVAANHKQICDLMLCGGKISAVLEELGVDFPVDIAYILFSVIMGTGEHRDFTNVLSYFKYIDFHTTDLFDHSAHLLENIFSDVDCTRGGEIWQRIKTCYNEWLFGDELFELYADGRPLSSGKPSFILTDSLSVSIITLRDVLTTLKNHNKKIGLITLRSKEELMVSFRRWKLTDFPSENIVTLDDIIAAGHLPNINMPTTPDTYSLARAAVGTKYSDSASAKGKYNDIFSKTLVVSSSPVTLFEAQSLGMGFAAIVNDSADKSHKDMFRQLESDFTLESISELTRQK